MTTNDDGGAATLNAPVRKTAKQDTVVVLVTVAAFIALAFIQLEIAISVVLLMQPNPDPLNVPWDPTINLVVLAITALETWAIHRVLVKLFKLNKKT
nr:hypothetical protein [Candidatus Sigynarchaeota archaeon]